MSAFFMVYFLGNFIDKGGKCMNKHEIFILLTIFPLKQNAVWEQIREICHEEMDFGNGLV